MHKSLLRWEIIGAIFVFAVGFPLHFAFQFSGDSSLMAIISPVNESIWEHLKLLFMPFYLFSVIEFLRFSHQYHNIFAAKTIAVLVGLAFIPAAYYIARFFLHSVPDWLNIVIFALAVILTFVLSYQFMSANAFSAHWLEVVGALLLPAIFLAFFMLTFFPPQLEIFRDPTGNFYGIPFRP